MRVTFDKDGYVEMLVLKGDLKDSIELEDDDTIDMKYLSCYKLGYEGTKLVLDADKVQRVENNLRAESLVYDLRKKITDSDYQVLRHIREKALGITTTMTDSEYLVLEAKRESVVRRIREIVDGCNLETDPNAIIQEGLKNKSELENKVEEPVEENVLATEETTTKKTSRKTKKTE